MTTYYIQENEQIVLYDTDLQKLQNTLEFMPQYKDLEIKETEDLIIHGVIMTQEEFEAEQEQKEKERIAKLFLTAADVERAIYKAKGMDFDDIIQFVEQSQIVGLDLKALKIELKANNFYRGNPYVNAIGDLLGFSSKQLDRFFETNDYKYLTTVKVTINPTPETATVEINGVRGNELNVPYASDVWYIALAEGYLTVEGELFEVVEDTAVDVELTEEPNIEKAG